MIDKHYLSRRPSRLRASTALREMVAETTLDIKSLIYPLFIKEGLTSNRPIASMPGQYQLALEQLKPEINQISSLGIPAVILFGIPSQKDARGSSALRSDGIVQRAIGEIKSINPELIVISDLCFCEYTSHGHCGVLKPNHSLDNDATLELLVEQAISHANSGADIIAPSGMLDGMIKALRWGLDEHAYQHIPLLSYAAKYASSCYGPFREAAEGSPQFGNRAQYQMDPANVEEALLEVSLDVEQGADILMVKPAQFYLDIVSRIKQAYPLYPLCAYQVSGVYSMIKLAGQQGVLDEDAMIKESILSIKRAGADCIITYFAKQIAESLNN